MIRAWSLALMLSAAAALAEGPTLERLPGADRSAGAYDVSDQPLGHASLEAAIAACAAGGGACAATFLTHLGGASLFGVHGSRPGPEGRAESVSAVVVRSGSGLAVVQILEVAVGEGFGQAWPAEVFRSPAGQLLRLPVRLAGTGAFNEDLYFLWQPGRWVEIDAQAWKKDLRLPAGHGLWKGVVVDPTAFTARSSVWREGDGNCCPSGGEVRVRLEVRGRALRAAAQDYRAGFP
jgi:hypothetical protein